MRESEYVRTAIAYNGYRDYVIAISRSRVSSLKEKRDGH